MKDFLVWVLGFFIVVPFMAFFPPILLSFVGVEPESGSDALLLLIPLYLIELGVLGSLINRFNLD